jgi:2',3'-cyclic-nucleotide 2'-phosphodiesterase (5'-nucleotidase family)
MNLHTTNLLAGVLLLTLILSLFPTVATSESSFNVKINTSSGSGRSRRRHLLTSIGNNKDNRNKDVVDLPFGDINLVVVTDVHSWIAGHGRHEENMNADYGDILSFYNLLQKYTDATRKDLFFVMNGDFMDGTGLSEVPPVHLTPLLEHMPWDAVNLGNHELYSNETVDWIVSNFVDHWDGHFLTSNTVLKETGKPIGNRYTYLHAQYSNATILTFGFLYDFTGNCALTLVEKVNDVVRQEWFLHVLRKDNFDAILILAHMHLTDPIITVLRKAIRNVVGPTMPIQFIAGHTHIRDYAILDDFSVSFEAGKFLDTLGFCSFPIRGTSPTISVAETGLSAMNVTELLFPHVFLDTNRKTLANVLNLDHLSTAAGVALTDKIHQTQDALGLLQPLGCATHTYNLRDGMDRLHSLWGLYMREIVPLLLTNHNDSLVFVQGTAALRYSLLQGTVLVDDVIAVCPFNNTIYKMAERLTGRQILEILNTSKANAVVETGDELPPFAVSTQSIDPDKLYDLATSEFHVRGFFERIKNATGLPVSRPKPLRNPKTGESWTTTNLFRDYVSEEWHCRPTSPSVVVLEPPAVPAKQEKPLTASVFIVLVICGLWVYQKRKRYIRSEYEFIGEGNITAMWSQRNLEQHFNVQTPTRS